MLDYKDIITKHYALGMSGRKKVADRINSLIKNDRYLTPKDREKLAAKQRENVESEQPPEADASIWEYNDIKHDHWDDIVLFQMGDFFEIYGEDANIAAAQLELHLASRTIPTGGRVDMCGIPAHSLEQYVEHLRQTHSVTVAPLDPETGKHKPYSMAKLEPISPEVQQLQEAAPPPEAKIPHYDPVRFSIRQYGDEPDDYAVWDATLDKFYTEGGRAVRFGNQESAENFLSELQGLAKETPEGTLENLVVYTEKGTPYRCGDVFHTEYSRAVWKDAVIDFINDTYIWYTIPTEPDRAPLKLRRDNFDVALDNGLFIITTAHEHEPMAAVPEEPHTYQVGDTVYLEGTAFQRPCRCNSG